MTWLRSRVRLSTAVLGLLFLITLTVYLLVRPPPQPEQTVVGVVTTREPTSSSTRPGTTAPKTTAPKASDTPSATPSSTAPQTSPSNSPPASGPATDSGPADTGTP